MTAAASPSPTLVPPNSLRQLVAKLAAAAGVPVADADLLADALVDADLNGQSTHGVSRLEIYLRRLQRGLIDPRASLTIERSSSGVLVLDANNGLGQVQAVKALDLLAPLARKNGVAVATIRSSQHFGALSYYCNRMASMGFILIAATNCEPAMAPAGGCQAYFGTNPIAASFPTGRGFPLKVDLATSIVARGNIIAAQKEQRPIPEGWALDAEGRPTTDPAAALAGSVLTMAGHKGYALALMVEMLSGVLSGAQIGGAVGSMYKDMEKPQGVGHFFCLIDIAAFMDMKTFHDRTGQLIDEVKAVKKRPDTMEILLPGERSQRTAAGRREHGVPVSSATLGELRRLCEAYQVPCTL